MSRENIRVSLSRNLESVSRMIAERQKAKQQQLGQNEDKEKILGEKSRSSKSHGSRSRGYVAPPRYSNLYQTDNSSLPISEASNGHKVEYGLEKSGNSLPSDTISGSHSGEHYVTSDIGNNNRQRMTAANSKNDYVSK